MNVTVVGPDAAGCDTRVERFEALIVGLERQAQLSPGLDPARLERSD